MTTNGAALEQEVVTLPDFYCVHETTAFNEGLKGQLGRYGVKTLLYHTEMIQHHLERIARHAHAAQKVLIRVNGAVSPLQRKAYNIRAARTLARKFFDSMTDAALDNELEHAGYNDCMSMTRSDAIDILVKEHIARKFEGESEGE